jgi:ABC-type bacteriocin/lantibiotic exporter with double-glycine peptidase domain
MKSKLQKISYILTKKQKIMSILIFFLTIINMFFELFSIALVIPLMEIILNGQADDRFPLLSEILNYFSFLKEDNGLIVLLLLIMSLYFIKSLYSQFFLWVKTNFSYTLISNVSKQLYSKYLYQKINYFFDKKSSELIKNITTESERFSLGYITHIIEICVEFLVIFSISILLFLSEPKGFFFISLFYLINILLFLFLSKSFLSKIGKDRMSLEKRRLMSIQQGLSIIQEIKLAGYQKIFTDFFFKISNKFSRILFKEAIISKSPKIWLEFIAIAGILIFLIILVKNDYQKDRVIIITSLYTIAAFRLIPSINKFVISVIQLKYNAKVVDVIYEDLSQKISEENKEKKNILEQISINGISFSYKDNTVLKDISYNFKKGKSYCIFGITGSGKSTFLKIILGLLIPQKGTVSIDGMIQKDEFFLERNFSYVSQNYDLIDGTILENITFKNEIDNLNKLNEILRICELEEFVKTLPLNILQNLGERGIKISGGQRQRIAIARALYFSPDMIVFDEATSALDNLTEKKIVKNLITFCSDKILIFVTHKKEIANFCNERISINNKILN